MKKIMINAMNDVSNLLLKRIRTQPPTIDTTRKIQLLFCRLFNVILFYHYFANPHPSSLQF